MVDNVKIEYAKKAVKYIESLDKPTKQRIKTGIEGLTDNPPKGDIKTMQGYSDGRKRLRVGKYRIIYNYGQDGEIIVLYIMDVDTRGDIYKQKGSVYMSAATKEAINLMEILPESDQNFALEFIKKLVLAWDPDYTKVTPAERKALEETEKDIADNGTISHEDINWDQGVVKIEIKQKVETACKIAGITVTELGARMGMSQASISKRLTTGKFTQAELEKMASIMGCEYHSIFIFPDGNRAE